MRERARMAGFGAAMALLALLWLAAPRPAAAAPSYAQQSFAPDLPADSRPSLARGADATASSSRGKVRRRLRSLARQAPGASGVYVFDTGAKGKRRVIFDRKAGKRRKLASNMKLFTTATALHRLGAKGRIETRVKRRGAVRKGRLKGQLYLIGGGDPSLGKGGMRALARQVRKAGIRRVGRGIVADDTVFDRRRGVPDSNWGPSPYIAPLSGLTYGGSTYDGDPAKAAAAAFRKRLRSAGVKVKGKIRVGRLPGKLRKRPAVAEHSSARIAALIAATNKPSNNFFAEMLLKRLWAKPGRKGTTRGGAKAVERYARKVGSKVRAKDGSGLTDGNKASPRDVVRLLVRAQRGKRRGKAFFRSLAKAGKEGTLDSRMEGTAAAGRCRGKTGTINGVSNLSGYCRVGRGRKVAFSILMNGVSSYDGARNLQDRMAVEIARYRP